LWKEGDSVTPIATNLIAQIMTYQPTLPKNNIEKSFLYNTLVQPILLPAGTYRMSTGYKVGMFYNGELTKPFTYPSQILNIQSAHSTSPNGGYFWFDLPSYSNINVITLNTTLNTTSSLVCPEIKTLTSEISVKNNINMNGNALANVGIINGLAFPKKAGIYCQNSTLPFLE
jgi:hypothetical protein